MAIRFPLAGMAASTSRTAEPGVTKTPLSVLDFGNALLRSIGQVMLQNNRYAGLLFLLGVAWSAPLLALAMLLGAVVSTLMAVLLAVPRAQVRDGLFGFNGALVGIALLVFLQPTVLTWGCMLVAAALSTVAMAALMKLLSTWNIPALTAPFVLVSWCFFLATASLGRLQPTGLLPAAVLPAAAAVEGVVNVATVAAGLFNGVAQVFFQQSVVTGLVLTLGLLVSSWRAGVAALGGSMLGVLVAWGLGAAEPAIAAGIFGFNGVLVAIALGSGHFAPGRRAMFYIVLATVVTPLVTAAVTAAVQPFGLPGLTLPFVLVTWLFLWAAPAFPALRRDGDDAA